MYAGTEPLHSFGHGLSFSTFDYRDLRLDHESISIDGAVTMSVDVTNSSDRAGDEVVQLYVSLLTSRVTRPRQDLTGFERIHLLPGNTRTGSLPLAGDDLA
jgi:beta-glucosidase